LATDTEWPEMAVRLGEINEQLSSVDKNGNVLVHINVDPRPTDHWLASLGVAKGTWVHLGFSIARGDTAGQPTLVLAGMEPRRQEIIGAYELLRQMVESANANYDYMRRTAIEKERAATARDTAARQELRAAALQIANS
jgi:hypothetical protein